VSPSDLISSWSLSSVSIVMLSPLYSGTTTFVVGILSIITGVNFSAWSLFSISGSKLSFSCRETDSLGVSSVEGHDFSQSTCTVCLNNVPSGFANR